jgi:DNA-dependent RNA polymerase auxiliary subunit epsilon
MRETADSLSVNMNRLADTADFLQNNKINITFLQDQISRLKIKLNLRVHEYESISRDMIELECTVRGFADNKTSLLIRSPF